MISKVWLALGFLGMLIISWSHAASPQQEVRLIPLEDFFRNPEKMGFKISPNGEYLSFLKPWQRRLNIYILKIGQDKAVRITETNQRDITDYLWVNDRRLVYLMDRDGDENFHAFGVNLDGSNFKELTPYENVRVQIIDELADSPKEILIGMNRRNPKVFDAYRLNISTGELTLVGKNPGNISTWLLDNAGHVRAAVASDGINDTLLFRPTENDPFRPIVTTNFKDALIPLAFTFDNQYLYVSSNLGRDKQAIYRYDVINGKLLDLIYEHPGVDVDTLLRSKARKIITGVSFSTDKRHYFFFDKTRQKMQKSLERLLPGYEIAAGDGELNLVNRDETRVIVRTSSDKSVGAYYLYNRVNGELKKLAEICPWLKETELAEVRPFQYQSRDGLTIHAYLTLPRGVKPKNLPVVVHPHGGPWSRDYWGYNPEVQFLANRGLAILQMNFRGSTGYGKAFWQAGFKQWGHKMQDDITDGVLALIEQGIADPRRVGIYGGSYGGYATLAGLTFSPDLYACGVDYVGPSNLFTLLASFPAYWGLELQRFYEMIGDPVQDKVLLTEISPLFQADKIKAPLLVAQGAHDPRVKKAESDQIVAALKKRGVNVLYLVKDNEGHGFQNEENRFDFYRAMEAFFGKYLNSRVPH